MTALVIPVTVLAPPTAIQIQTDTVTANPGQSIQLLVRDVDTDAVIPAAALSLIRGGGATISPVITGNDGKAALVITGAPGRYVVLAAVGALTATVTLQVVEPGQLPDTPAAFTVGDTSSAAQAVQPEQYRTFDQVVQDQAVAIQSRARTGLTDLSIGSILRALVDAVAGVSLWLQAQVAELFAKMRAATSSGAALDSWMADYSFTRLDAVAATGIVQFSRATTSAIATIPVGAAVGTASNSSLYQVIADTANPMYSNGAYTMGVGVGLLSVPVRCISTGIGGNAQPGAINALGSALPGVDSVTNSLAITSGADRESDDELRDRFRLFIAGLARGNVDAISYAISTAQPAASFSLVEGLSYDTGAASVGYFYVVVDDGSGAPSPEFLASVRSAIDSVRPIGEANFGVFAPQVLPASITIAVTVATGANVAAVRSLVSAAITAYRDSLGIGQSLPISRLSQVAYDASSAVIDVSGVTVNGSTANIVATGKQVIRGGTVTVS